jgi:hypothetical protein
MRRGFRSGVLCAFTSAAVPVWAGQGVWNFGAPAVGDQDKNLTGPPPRSSPSSATATQHELYVDGVPLIAYAYSSRISAPPSASIAGALAALSDPSGKPRHSRLCECHHSRRRRRN